MFGIAGAGASPSVFVLGGILLVAVFGYGYQTGSSSAEKDCLNDKVSHEQAVNQAVEEATLSFNTKEVESAAKLAQAEKAAATAWRNLQHALSLLPKRSCGFTDDERSLLDTYRNKTLQP